MKVRNHSLAFALALAGTMGASTAAFAPLKGRRRRTDMQMALEPVQKMSVAN